MGAETVVTCGAPAANGGSPAGECAQAMWHRPRLLARVIGPSCTVATAQASDCWVLRRLSVRARPGYGEADVAGARCDVACGFPNSKIVPFNPVWIKFSPVYEIEVRQLLNTKVVQQLTLYQSYKSSRVV
jgi:hypothetical protein